MRENMPFAHHFLFCLFTSVHEYVTSTSNNDQDYSKEFTHGGQRGWLIMLYFEGNRLNYVIQVHLCLTGNYILTMCITERIANSVYMG